MNKYKFQKFDLVAGIRMLLDSGANKKKTKKK